VELWAESGLSVPETARKKDIIKAWLTIADDLINLHFNGRKNDKQ
tara:strand:- start:1363 stop:1497 length:135 start_codon:yes stop_codon:yes gene_type:complete